MAKGLRASSRKKNNANLRAKVFNPVYEARVERLSAKLQDLAAKPRPESEKAMDVDEVAPNEGESKPEENEMDVDYQFTNKRDRKGQGKKGHSGRIGKRTAKRKAKNSVVFPSIIARQKKIAAAKKKK